MSEHLISVSSGRFDEVVLGATTPVIVEFSAVWCPPCRALGVVLGELAGRYRGRIAVAVVDVEAAPDIAQRYQVRSMPTLLAFRGGQVVAQLVGFGSRAPVERLFAELDGVTPRSPSPAAG